MLDTILNLFFPVTCVLCEAPVLERRYAAACPDCWAALAPVEPPYCPKCGEPFAAIEGLCGACRHGEHAFDFARSAFLFNDTLREIIHHLKYSDRVSLARPLSDAMKHCLDQFTGELIIPVPLHRAREKDRGYNQAELIALRLGRPVNPRILRRRKNTPSQTGLSRSERQRNLAGAFEVRRGVQLPGSVILVDDVYTTGSTMHEIARTLKRAGVQRVEVLTAARVSKEVICQ